MTAELDKILYNSEKADLLDVLKKLLSEADTPKVIIAYVADHEEDGGYDDRVMLLGVRNTYEALGILDIAKEHILNTENLDIEDKEAQ